MTPDGSLYRTPAERFADHRIVHTIASKQEVEDGGPRQESSASRKPPTHNPNRGGLNTGCELVSSQSQPGMSTIDGTRAGGLHAAWRGTHDIPESGELLQARGTAKRIGQTNLRTTSDEEKAIRT